VSNNRRRSILNFVIGTAVITTIGALLSPLAIAWWKNSTWSNARLPANKVTELRNQVLAAEKTLSAQPDDPAALDSIVKAKLQLNDLKGSLPALEKLATLKPQVPEYMVLLAQTQQHLGDRETAVASYRKVLTNQPQNIQALQGLVSLLIEGNKPEAAIGLVQAAIKDQTAKGASANLTPLKLLLAQVYVSQKRNDDALPIYDELIQANNQDFRPLLAQGIVYKQMGNTHEAQALLSQAAEIAPAQYKDQIQSIAKSAVAPTITPKIPAAQPSNVPSPTVVPSPLNSSMPLLSPSSINTTVK
jgi:tetratricopeptide (TPR) repeat protein